MIKTLLQLHKKSFFTLQCFHFRSPLFWRSFKVSPAPLSLSPFRLLSILLFILSLFLIFCLFSFSTRPVFRLCQGVVKAHRKKTQTVKICYLFTKFLFCLIFLFLYLFENRFFFKQEKAQIFFNFPSSYCDSRAFPIFSLPHSFFVFFCF